MKFIAIAISIFVTQSLVGQDSTRILIPAGSIFSDVVTPAVMFRYKEFKPGRILLKDDVLYQANLNYNLFNAEIMFAVPGGDTMAIDKEKMLNIKRVTIDTDLYVYNKGYLQIVRENKNGTLARRQQYHLVSREKIGGYNFASPQGSIDSYNSFSDRANNRHDLVVRENISLQLKTEYFIGDSYKLFLPVNRKNLEKVFFKKRNEITSYFNEHVVDFKNEKQVTGLFIFLTENL
ncbi:MAG: hypothetical protein JWQ40_1085 [Segetibacter sp.]|nr:hypothetical protein [Segetibacter sp.]